MRRLFPSSPSVLALTLFVISGCATATPYQQAYEDSGYGYLVRTHPTMKDVYVATYKANCNTTTAQAESYVMRSAEEFCEAMWGRSPYLISDKNVGKGEEKNGTLVESSGCISVHGNFPLRQCIEWQKDPFGDNECLRYRTVPQTETRLEGPVKARIVFECRDKVK